MPERRTSVRKSGSFKISLQDQSSQIISNVKNISTSGVYCQVDHPLQYMKKVIVELKLPVNKKSPKKLSCDGVIVRCDRVEDTNEECYDAAIYFTDLSNENRLIIDKYLESS